MKLLRPVTLVALSLFFAPFLVTAKEAPVFHFYGAYDCPPCMAFKRDGLPIVEKEAKSHGYKVAVNLTKKTQDVPTVGIYGKSDALLREAAKQMGRAYPPIFFLTIGDNIHRVYGPNWQKAFAEIKKLSRP